MRPTILFGGTFDPVHNGHLAVADAVADAFAVTVDMVPAADPPHRPPPGATAAQRADMLDLAVADHPALRVDRRELRRGGASFTIDTLREVRAETGADVPVIWLLGSDALVGLASWKRWREMFEFAHILAYKRPGSELGHAWLRSHASEVFAEIAPRWRSNADLTEAASGGFSIFQPRTERSEAASEVRSRIAGSGDWPALVPPAVARYILDRKLYLAGRV
jgi:nicotinate-nucleotide adenylyltransferase